MTHKFLRFHNFTHHYFNIYFLIEFEFYSIIKPFIRILTHHIFINKNHTMLIFSVYCTRDGAMWGPKGALALIGSKKKKARVG